MSRRSTVVSVIIGIGVVAVLSMYAASCWVEFRRRRRKVPELLASIASLNNSVQEILVHRPENRDRALEATFQKYAQRTLTISDVSSLPDEDINRINCIRRATNYVTTDFEWGNISENKIRTVHAHLMCDEDPSIAAVYRKHDVGLNNYGKLSIPPRYDEVPQLMAEFVVWLNSQPRDFERRLLVAAEAKLRLVAIHPFADGNGRTSRALFAGLLCQLDNFPFVAIPHASRKSYFTAIQLHRETGDTEQFIKFLLLLVEESFYHFIQDLQSS